MEFTSLKRKTYTVEKKLEIIEFFKQCQNQYKTCKKFGLNTKTLKRFVKSEDKIRGSELEPKQENRGRAPFFPLMEAQLFEEFVTLSRQEHTVKHWWSWFRSRSKEICAKLYPENDFTFSQSWFRGFKRRYKLPSGSMTRNVEQNGYSAQFDRCTDTVAIEEPNSGITKISQD